MGEDARWVCHDCKTVCSPGGRPLFQGIPETLFMGDIDNLKNQITDIVTTLRIEDADRIVSYLDDLKKWLSRHEGHNIHIGSDYSTDVMDLDDYHDETVDGEVKDYTRLEGQIRTHEEWRQTGINKVKDIIMECKSYGAYGALIDVDKAAEKLYDQFCSDMAAEMGG